MTNAAPSAGPGPDHRPTEATAAVAPAPDPGAVRDDDTAAELRGNEPGPTEWGEHPHGAGPWAAEHTGPPPDDDRLDPVLLAEGDRRNVVDAYRYWTREAIVADIDRRRHPFHIAIENFGHDANIGTVVRTANAFAAGAVHIVGRRRWNRRGAMVTDRYQHIVHHPDIETLLEFTNSEDLSVVAVDNVPGSVPLETVRLPRRCMLLFGQEGPGVSEGARDAAVLTVSIAQFGSTRSINAGVAAGIAMHTWIRQHADLTTAW
ncbi:TrmH family RNA methyltransferase [Nocardia flavorosea]|uniref:RNA methyltransferase n=1 Tax=Nocardia flavorosea TaxID=53429 RepID=A0A846YBZ8_9NOCA|nr:TrmH family RNA methyltransferase [Nocardia flavorosea]NKY56377.1 RNA methyltransferase [Nocardia flavorosea]